MRCTCRANNYGTQHIISYGAWDGDLQPCNGSIVIVAAAIVQSDSTPSLVVEKPIPKARSAPGESRNDPKEDNQEMLADHPTGE